MWRFFTCFNKIRGPKCISNGMDAISIIGLVFEAILFGLFTSCMMMDQYGAVSTNDAYNSKSGHTSKYSLDGLVVDNTFGIL